MIMTRWHGFQSSWIRTPSGSDHLAGSKTVSPCKPWSIRLGFPLRENDLMGPQIFHQKVGFCGILYRCKTGFPESLQAVSYAFYCWP